MRDFEYGVDEIYGVVALCDDASAKSFVELSAALGKQALSLILLGEKDSRAHVTLLQVMAPVAEAKKLWESVALAGKSVSFRSTGLGFDDWDEAKVPVIGVESSAELLQLHAEILEKATDSKLKIVSGHGANFHPHVTLAFWPEPPLEYGAHLTPSSAETFDGRWALVRIGHHGTASGVVDY